VFFPKEWVATLFYEWNISYGSMIINRYHTVRLFVILVFQDLFFRGKTDIICSLGDFWRPDCFGLPSAGIFFVARALGA